MTSAIRVQNFSFAAAITNQQSEARNAWNGAIAASRSLLTSDRDVRALRL